MYTFIGIGLALIIGMILGGVTARIFNTGKETLNPLVYTLVGVLGSVLGAFIASKFASGSIKTVLLQAGVGVAFAVILLVFLLLARGRKDPLDEDFREEIEEEEEGEDN